MAQRNLRALPKDPVAATPSEAPKGPRTYTRTSLKLPSKEEQAAVADGKEQNIENMIAAIVDMSPIVADAYRYEDFGGGVRAGLTDIVEALNDPQTRQYPVARIQQILPVMRAMCEPLSQKGFASNQIGIDLIVQTGLDLEFFYLGNTTGKQIGSIQFAPLQSNGKRKIGVVSTDIPGAETVMGLLEAKLREFKAAQQVEERAMRHLILENTDGNLLEVLAKGNGEVGMQVMFQELEGHKVWPGAARIKVRDYRISALAGAGHCQQEVAAAISHKVTITVGDLNKSRPDVQEKLPHDKYVALLHFHRLVRAMKMQAEARAAEAAKKNSPPAQPD